MASRFTTSWHRGCFASSRCPLNWPELAQRPAGCQPSVSYSRANRNGQCVASCDGASRFLTSRTEPHMVVTTVLYGHGVRWAVIVSWTCQSCWRSPWKMECFDQQVSHQQVVFAWVFVLRTLSAGSMPAGIVLVTFRIPYSDKCPAYLCLLQNALPTLSVA